MNLINQIKNDMRFAFKYKVIHILLLLLLFYVFILLILNNQVFMYAKIYLILSDPIILGFFFIGAIFLIERNEGIIKYNFITTIKPATYIVSKALSLAIIGVIIAFILSIVKSNDLNLITLITVFLSNVFMTILGILISLKAKNVNQYIGYSMLTTLVLFGFFILSLIFNDIFILRFNPITLIFLTIQESFFNTYQYYYIYLMLLILFIVIMYFITNFQFKKLLYEGKL